MKVIEELQARILSFEAEVELKSQQNENLANLIQSRCADYDAIEIHNKTLVETIDSNRTFYENANAALVTEASESKRSLNMLTAHSDSLKNDHIILEKQNEVQANELQRLLKIQSTVVTPEFIIDTGRIDTLLLQIKESNIALENSRSETLGLTKSIDDLNEKYTLADLCHTSSMTDLTTQYTTSVSNGITSDARIKELELEIIKRAKDTEIRNFEFFTVSKAADESHTMEKDAMLKIINDMTVAQIGRAHV